MKATDLPDLLRKLAEAIEANGGELPKFFSSPPEQPPDKKSGKKKQKYDTHLDKLISKKLFGL